MAMFKKGNKTEDNKVVKKSGGAVSPANALNSLVKGTIITGEINSENDIRVDGIIKGTLNCQAKVIIGPSGLIQGEVICKSAIIEGKFEGNLHVEGLLNVKETAEVSGDVFTNKLIMQSGAVFNVACKMGNEQSATKTTQAKVSAPIKKQISEK